MSVGDNIQRLREAQDISQAEMARRVSISQSMLSQIEKGIKNPSLLVGKEIADALGCSVDRLFE